MTKKVSLQKAYIIYTRPWSEHSQMAYLFSREYGMLYVTAKGAKRPYSLLRPALTLFQPLCVRWSGKKDIKTLTSSEPIDFFPIKGTLLSSAWYMNELLLTHIAHEDPYPVLWDSYHQSLQDLVAGYSPAMVLRRFEWVFLKELGYGIEDEMPALDQISTESYYRQVLHDQMNLCLQMDRVKTKQVFQDLSQMRSSF